jgi:hypothetical protein
LIKKNIFVRLPTMVTTAKVIMMVAKAVKKNKIAVPEAKSELSVRTTTTATTTTTTNTTVVVVVVTMMRVA